MAKYYRVENLQDALNLAQQFKLKGEYDLFRGQGRNWRVIPTTGRLTRKQFKSNQEKLERLLYFFTTNDPLKKYTTNADWFFAVAQHYGIGTNYIDFTSSPEVAAFFATNSKSNKINVDCVIVCLNENDFSDFIRVTKIIYEKDKVIAPYIVKIDVDNLWRLQAQNGCFLYTPYANIEYYYDFDKIVFPYQKSLETISAADIYPEHKSELEILLDHFFNNEKRIEGQERFRQFIEETKIRHFSLPDLEFDNLLKRKLIHPSWESSEYNKWNYSIIESWKQNTKEALIELPFSFKVNMQAQIELLIQQLIAYKKANKINRYAQYKFEVIVTPKLTKKLSKIISRSCSRIWDGTKNLPYSDEEIFSIISKYICLEIYESKYDKTLSLSNEELVTLELTNKYGSITRCYASPSKIVLSFRDDIKDILTDRLTENITSEILLYINQPNLLFDFSKLVRLFKEEIVSYQVLYNSENNKPVVFYTPSQISVMGYA